VPPLLLTFPQAMQAVIDNDARITRREWDDPETWCELRGQWLMIRRFGTWSTWQINDGDMLADDWYEMD
jgi:hypothetical protein